MFVVRIHVLKFTYVLSPGVDQSYWYASIHHGEPDSEDGYKHVATGDTRALAIRNVVSECRKWRRMFRAYRLDRASGQ